MEFSIIPKQQHYTVVRFNCEVFGAVTREPLKNAAENWWEDDSFFSEFRL